MRCSLHFYRKLNSAGDDENDQYQQKKADTARRSVTPISAVAPGWNGAQQGKNEEDDENCSEHDLFPFKRLWR
jgi:hypothetical protein